MFEKIILSIGMGFSPFYVVLRKKALAEIDTHSIPFQSINMVNKTPQVMSNAELGFNWAKAF